MSSTGGEIKCSRGRRSSGRFVVVCHLLLSRMLTPVGGMQTARVLLLELRKAQKLLAAAGDFMLDRWDVVNVAGLAGDDDGL
jgi:hypothetical protein